MCVHGFLFFQTATALLYVFVCFSLSIALQKTSSRSAAAAAGAQQQQQQQQQQERRRPEGSQPPSSIRVKFWGGAAAERRSVHVSGAGHDATWLDWRLAYIG